MTYTQMLFALTFDKLVFDHEPDWKSIIGSSLILGPAIFVAMQKNVEESKDAADARDEEAQQGLLMTEDEGEPEDVEGVADVEDGISEDGDGEGRMSVGEVQTRTLR